MKIVLCLFLIEVYSCLGGSEQSTNYWSDIAYDDVSYGLEQQGPIARPCSLEDVNCIKQYFAHTFQCSPAQGPGPNQVWIKTIPMYLPHVNVTFVLNNVQVNGFNEYKIKEFYVNKETNNLVMEVVFQSLWVHSPVTVITFHRKGKQPLEVVDYAYIEYKNLSLTLTVSHAGDQKLSEAHVYTFISDAAPKNGLGPNFTESKNPDVTQRILRIIGNIPLSLQEAFVTKGPILMSVFLQKSICSQ